MSFSQTFNPSISDDSVNGWAIPSAIPSTIQLDSVRSELIYPLAARNPSHTSPQITILSHEQPSVRTQLLSPHSQSVASKNATSNNTLSPLNNNSSPQNKTEPNTNSVPPPPTAHTARAPRVYNGELSESSRHGSLIVNVWADNLHSEIRAIEQIVDQYNFIAMDTEFPGIVARPIGNFKTNADYQYQTMKCNVDLLKLIQLGLCFSDSQGRLVPGTCTWQFNFKFSLAEDMYAQDSIDLLKQSGIDFDMHEKRGIDPTEFAELLMTSGIVLNDSVTWITFHSSYDFGYLLKLLTHTNLPVSEQEFFDTLYLYFPCFYDCKFLMNNCQNLNGGLSRIAEQLSIDRVGHQHQAGSDALLTSAIFFDLRRIYFNEHIQPSKYMNYLYNLGSNINKPELAQRYKQKNFNDQQDDIEEESTTQSQLTNSSILSNDLNERFNSLSISNNSTVNRNGPTNRFDQYRTPDVRNLKKKTVFNQQVTATPPVVNDFTT